MLTWPSQRANERITCVLAKVASNSVENDTRPSFCFSANALQPDIAGF